MPPSDPSALKRFRRAANRLGMNLELISLMICRVWASLMAYSFAPPRILATTPIALRKQRKNGPDRDG